MVEKENPFKLLEPNGKVPEQLKKALVSEIDSIRNSSTIIELFVGNFLNTLTTFFSMGNGTSNSSK